ncbi:MAG: hypothetical protein A2075_09195 [Geobacteraceae bacterium GWC2_58_44]|nr:MAG: hypothetical protein A2075_09195 [Geobacteraceae bacterium GWC2_58_44]HBG07688.1 hypothetical protein [Geobacter sp.]
MKQKTDITIKFEGRTYDVPVGFTAEEFVDSLASTNPKAVGAKLIKDGAGAYTLKPQYQDKG